MPMGAHFTQSLVACQKRSSSKSGVYLPRSTRRDAEESLKLGEKRGSYKGNVFTTEDNDDTEKTRDQEKQRFL